MADPSYDPYRSIRELQRQLAKVSEPLRKFQELGAQRYLDQIDALNRQASAPNEAIRRAVESIQVPQRQMQSVYTDLARALEGYDIAKTLSIAHDIGRKVEIAYRAGLPENWRELAVENTERARDRVVEDGLPIIWVPNASLTERVLAADPSAEAMAVLVSDREEVLADIDVVLTEVSDPRFARLVEMARKALAAARDGHPEAAQALSAAVFTAALTGAEGAGYDSFAEVRKMAEDHPPDQAGIRTYRTALVVTLMARYLQGHGYQQPGFNRNDTLHNVSEEQYTESLSLASLMAVAGLLREFQQWVEEADEDEGVADAA